MDLQETQDIVDPNLLENGSFIFFTKSVEIELRLLDGEEEKLVGKDKIQMKVYGVSQDGRALELIKMELTSEVDVFFNYTKSFDRAQFFQFASDEQINVQFEEFPASFQNIVQLAIDSKNQKIVFLMEVGKPTGNLVFLEDLGHKNSILLSISLEMASRETVKANIMFRYSRANKRLIDKHDKLFQINEYVRLKNPELLNIFQKTFNTPKTPPYPSNTRSVSPKPLKSPFH